MFNLAPAIPARSDLDWCWFLRRHGRAGDVIERALHDIGVMDHSGWAHWHPSTLTTTGAPVLATFTTGDDRLSIITEIANPASDPKTRFAAACKAICILGGTPPSPAFCEAIDAAQGVSALTYGARLGLRHDGNALQISVYAELSNEASDLTALFAHTPFGAGFDGFEPGKRATMLGYDTQTGQGTLYCDTKGADGPDIQDAHPIALCVGLRAGAANPALAYQFCQQDISKSGATVALQLRRLKRQIFQRYPCLNDHPQQAHTGDNFAGTYWVCASQSDQPTVSIDVAAPWLGSDSYT